LIILTQRARFSGMWNKLFFESLELFEIFRVRWQLAMVLFFFSIVYPREKLQSISQNVFFSPFARIGFCDFRLNSRLFAIQTFSVDRSYDVYIPGYMAFKSNILIYFKLIVGCLSDPALPLILQLNIDVYIVLKVSFIIPLFICLSRSANGIIIMDDKKVFMNGLIINM